MATRIENALATVERLTEIIHFSRVAAFEPGDGDCGVFSNVTRLSFGHAPENTTVIEALQKLTRAYEGDDPEERGAACEARDALLALRNAAAALLYDIEQDLDALTVGLTAGEARQALDAYAAQPFVSDQPIEKG